MGIVAWLAALVNRPSAGKAQFRNNLLRSWISGDVVYTGTGGDPVSACFLGFIGNCLQSIPIAQLSVLRQPSVR